MGWWLEAASSSDIAQWATALRRLPGHFVISAISVECYGLSHICVFAYNCRQTEQQGCGLAVCIKLSLLNIMAYALDTKGWQYVQERDLLINSKILLTKPHSGIIVLMLSYLLPIRWQYHTVVSDHTI